MESAPIQDSASCDAFDLKTLSMAINHLAFHLYRQLASEKMNLFFSPLSISTALAMVFCGARNETAQEMRHVLGYEIADVPNEAVKFYFRILLASIDEIRDSYTLSNANVLFNQHDFNVKEEFKTLLRDSFKALSMEVDFRNESVKAVQQANDWVETKTNGMISQLLDSLDPDTVMVVLNAVYFKGFWMHQFKEKATFLQYFYNNGLETNAKQVEMMHLKESFPFAETETYQVLQIPYKGDEVAMLILLPQTRNGLEELENGLSSNFIRELKSGMRKTKVQVALPKFRIEYSKSVKEQFQNLGMNRAFSAGSHFDGISDSKELLISDIIHKAVLVVNEEGSEASAATAVVMMRRCLELVPEFIVDHPFLFVIYNSKMDLILFMGRVDEL